MRHTNSNMSPAVLEGIAAGEAAVGQPWGDEVFERELEVAEAVTAALVPTGDRPFVVGAFLKAKALAQAQGFIAAYRTATEL